MGSEWKEIRLSDIVNLIGGGTPKRSHAEYWGGSIPWLSVKDFNNDYRHVDSAEESISEIGLLKSSTKVLTEGQLIISARGTVGALAQLSKPMAFNQSCYGIDAKPEQATNDFLYYLIKYSIANFKQITHGAVFDTITRETFDHILVKLPPLPEQRAIAHILGSLDDKIELNRRMNETLEAMARALFKSWFIDFDPVIDNTLAAGNPIPEELQARAALRESLGDGRKPLPDEIRDLFPSEFEFTEEMGWIPKGWCIGPISKFAKLNPESWTAKNAPEYVQYVDLANTKNGRINLIVPYKFFESPSRARRTLRQGDSIIGTVRPGNRSFAYIQEYGLTGSTGFAVMRPKKGCFRSFVYLCLTRNETIDHFAHLADGAAYPAIRPEVIAGFNCVLPREDLLEHFDAFVYPWINGIGERESQINSLTMLHDTLLPKLLSGEIRIPETDKMMGVAV
jgi:type I restriction enzyme, S subunit